MWSDLKQFRTQIIKEKKNRSYDALEKKYGVNRFYLWNIINDKNYSPPIKILDVLGIRHFALALVCSKHGIVHCYDCQTQIVKKKSEPKAQSERLKPYESWLWGIGKREILQMLKNRYEME